MSITQTQAVNSLRRNEAPLAIAAPKTSAPRITGSVPLANLQATSMVNGRENVSLAGALGERSGGDVQQVVDFIRASLKADKWGNLDTDVQEAIIRKLNASPDKPAMAKALAHSKWKSNETIEEQLYDKVSGSRDDAARSFMQTNFYNRTRGLPVGERAQEISEAMRFGRQDSKPQRQRVTKLITDASSADQAALFAQLGWASTKSTIAWVENRDFKAAVSQAAAQNVTVFATPAEVIQAASDLGQLSKAGVISILGTLQSTRGADFADQAARMIDYEGFGFIYFTPGTNARSMTAAEDQVVALEKLALDANYRGSVVSSHRADLNQLKSVLPADIAQALQTAFENHHTPAYFQGLLQRAETNLSTQINAEVNRLLLSLLIEEGYRGDPRRYDYPYMDYMMFSQLSMMASNGGISHSDLSIMMAVHQHDGPGWTRGEKQALLRAVMYLPWQDTRALRRAMWIVRFQPTVDMHGGNGGPDPYFPGRGGNGGPPAGGNNGGPGGSNGGPGGSNGGPGRSNGGPGGSNGGPGRSNGGPGGSNGGPGRSNGGPGRSNGGPGGS